MKRFALLMVLVAAVTLISGCNIDITGPVIDGYGDNDAQFIVTNDRVPIVGACIQVRPTGDHVYTDNTGTTVSVLTGSNERIEWSVYLAGNLLRSGHSSLKPGHNVVRIDLNRR